MAEFQIQSDTRKTLGVIEFSESESRGLYVLAPGAGGNMDSKTILKLRDGFLGIGLDVARFDFYYKREGKSIPDSMPALMDCYKATVEHIRREFKPRRLILGGHSMGGRTASMLAAEGFSMDALMLSSYPLHPSGKPEKLRDAHLPAISVPTLCMNGDHDELCRQDLMELVLPRLQPTWQMHWIQGADHSYAPSKGSGRKQADIVREISETADAWINSI